MQYYILKSLFNFFKYSFIVDGSITKKEFKTWLKENYFPTRFARIKTVTQEDIDPTWGIRVTKENGKIECSPWMEVTLVPWYFV